MIVEDVVGGVKVVLEVVEVVDVVEGIVDY